MAQPHEPARDPRMTENAALRSIMEDLHKPELIQIGKPSDTDGPASVHMPEIVAMPKGMELVSLKPFIEQYRLVPERRTGTARLTTIESVIEHTQRFAGASSVVFADRNPKTPSVTVVLDYHEAGPDERIGTRHGKHRGHYAFPLSEPWTAWAAIDGNILSQSDFAEFLEDRIGDVLPPLETADGEADAKVHEIIRLLGGVVAGPSRLLELSRGLRINESSRVKSAINISTGEVQLMFESEHQDEAGAPMKVPNIVLIGVPVFENGPLYRIPVRLRYRLNNGRVTWILQRYRPELTFEHAFEEAVERIRAETGLPILFGAPEA